MISKSHDLSMKGRGVPDKDLLTCESYATYREKRVLYAFAGTYRQSIQVHRTICVATEDGASHNQYATQTGVGNYVHEYVIRQFEHAPFTHQFTNCWRRHPHMR